MGFDENASGSPSGLLAYWPIEEGSGSVTANGVSGGATGVINGAEWINDPVRGVVLSFDGVGSYVAAGTIPALDQSGSDFTWSFWHYQRSIPNVNAVVVRIPPGVNASTDVQIRVVSSDPAVAVPVGATGGTLTLTFAAGAANEQAIDVQATGASGGAQFTLENDLGMSAGNTLSIAVIDAAGIRLEEDFAAATLDPAKWEINEQGFEATGTGVFLTDLATTPGTLEIYGLVDTDFWPGASIKTVSSFTATQELPLIVEVDRLSIDPATSTAACTGMYLTTDDRSSYIFFGQNYGETGWQVNVNPGNPTGSGTALGAFSALAQDTGPHRLKIVADGQVAEVFLDGVSADSSPSR